MAAASNWSHEQRATAKPTPAVATFTHVDENSIWSVDARVAIFQREDHQARGVRCGMLTWSPPLSKPHACTATRSNDDR